MPTFANLPGATVEVLDQGLRVSRPPSGPKILLLGMTTSTHVNATPYIPYKLSDGSLITAHSIFKDASGDDNELTKALYECYVTGGRDIELVNILPTASGSFTAANDLYGYFGKAYTDLINYDADIVVPVGAYIDTSVTANYSGTGTGSQWSFGYQLANFCYQATKTNNTCLGVIPASGATVSPSGTPTLAEVETWVAGLETYEGITSYDGTTETTTGVPGNYAYVATTGEQLPANYAAGDVTDSKGNKVDIGAYISVVAGNLRAANDVAVKSYPTLGYYNTEGAASYAGLIASLPAKSAPTNKVVSGVTAAQNISKSQANRLAGGRFVTFLGKAKGITIASAMTGAFNLSQYYRSDYVRLSTVRIVHDAINYVRETADQFIGEPNNAPQRNAMAAAIENSLKSMQESGALRRFNFNIFSTPTDQVLGRATVELVLVPAFELQTITVVVSLTSE